MLSNFVQTSFLGGEWAKSSRGGHDRPEYKKALALSTGYIPLENNALARCPGFAHAGPTRLGRAGRLISFAFKQAAPYNMEFSTGGTDDADDGWLQFWNGTNRVTTRDQNTIASISTANPAVIETGTPHGWTSGDRVVIGNLGTLCPKLQNKDFRITVVDTTHFSIAETFSPFSNVDGSTLGWSTPDSLPTVSRVLEFATVWGGSRWPSLRSVQTEKKTFLLNGEAQPYILSVTSDPDEDLPATFDLDVANFLDGPYFDPPTGLLGTASGLDGVITVTASYAAWVSTRAYAKGDFVAQSGNSYQSLEDANLNNTPSPSSTHWKLVSPGAAVGPNGFVASDIGRLIRMQNDSNWTWGKITGLASTGAISGSLAGSVSIGDMDDGAGLDAAFSGSVSKVAADCASASFPNNAQISKYIGKDYSAASAQQISSVLVYPASDEGWTNGVVGGTMTFELYASNTLPTSATNGTKLGSFTGPNVNDTDPITIASNDLTTSWKYVWVRYFCAAPGGGNGDVYAASVQFFTPTSVAGAGVTVQVVGPALTSTSITLIRMGLYSDTTGWPTCGTYHEGRIWLASKAIPNRIDACKSNGISLTGTSVDFAPTAAAGTVGDSNGISYTFNAPSTNPIFWMRPHAEGIIAGTLKGEWLVQATTQNQILTPSNIQAHQVTEIGSVDAEPARTEHTVVFIQRYQRKIMEYFADVFSGKFSAPNLAKDAKHLTKGKLRELAYQQELAPIVWARKDDGNLVGCTYKRDSLMVSQGPTFNAFFSRPLGTGKTLARTVESICVGPTPDGTLDSLAAVTFDPVSGLRHVEVMQPIMDDDDPITSAWFLDDAVVPSSATEVTLANGTKGIRFYGLHHLNGASVDVFLGGLDFGSYDVADGQVEVPYGADPDGVGTKSYLDKLKVSGEDFPYAVSVNGDLKLLPCVIGLGYTSKGKMLRTITANPELGGPGRQGGPAFGKFRRLSGYAVNFVHAVKMKFGTDFDLTLKPTDFRTNPEGGKPWPAGTLFNRMHRAKVEHSDDLDGQLCFQVDRPYPSTIAAIGIDLDTKD